MFKNSIIKKSFKHFTKNWKKRNFSHNDDLLSFALVLHTNEVMDMRLVRILFVYYTFDLISCELKRQKLFFSED